MPINIKILFLLLSALLCLRNNALLGQTEIELLNLGQGN